MTTRSVRTRMAGNTQSLYRHVSGKEVLQLGQGEVQVLAEVSILVVGLVFDENPNGPCG